MSESIDRVVPLRVVVAVSGSGRSLDNLCQHQAAGSCDYQIVGVICSHRSCRGLDVAAKWCLDVFQGDFPMDDSGEMVEWLRDRQVDWIALAGFVKPFPLNHGYGDKVINIHPSLLPHFGGQGMYGIRVHREVIRCGASITGASVHRVTAHYDEGPVVAQIKIPVGTADAEQLAADVFMAECQLYPFVLNGLAQGRLPLSEGQIAVISFDESRELIDA